MRRATPALVTLALASMALASARADVDSHDDAFTAGYATAVLQRDFGIEAPELSVRDGVVRVPEARLGGNDVQKVVDVLSRIEGVVAVELVDGTGQLVTHARPPPEPGVEHEGGIEFLPDRELFGPLLADPRWPRFSVIYQRYFSDDRLEQVAAASFGETFPLARWAGFGGGAFEVGIQGGVFSIFDFEADSFDLINSDFLGGIFASYRRGERAATLRIFHQSSHLGDEFLLRNRATRINLSFEAMELLLSREVAGIARFYAGGGVLLRRDPGDLDRLSVQGGLELRSPIAFLDGHVRPVAALDIQSRQESDWHPDFSTRLGAQLESSAMRRMRLQLLLEHYDGRSPNGQFFERDIDYLGLGAHLLF